MMKYHNINKKEGVKDEVKVKYHPSTLVTNMIWSVTKAKLNSLTGEKTFDPRAVPNWPTSTRGRRWRDNLVWRVWSAVDEAERQAPYITSQKTVLCVIQREYILRLICRVRERQHTTRHQATSSDTDRVNVQLLRQQGSYQDKGVPGEVRVTYDKLMKTSFLGQDPSGERTVTDILWGGDELSEWVTLLKDV